MTRDDVIRMAREASLLIPSFRIDGGLALGACTLPDFERFAALVAAAEREECARYFRPEMCRMRVSYEHVVKILTSIHALLYPPVVTDTNGQVWKFKSPVSEEQMQELSDRIRAIPDELAALDAAIRARGN